MAKRITNKAEDGKEVKIPIYEAVGEYGISSTSGSTSTKPIEEREISSFPAPRDYIQELVTPASEQRLSEYKKAIKRQIYTALRGTNKEGISKEEEATIRKSMYLADRELDSTELLSFAFANNTLIENKILMLLPELLYRENRALSTLSGGTAHRASLALSLKGDTQLTLFPEVKEEMEPLSYGKKAALIPCNYREWAKRIYNTNSPQNTQIRAIKDAIENISKKKICASISNGIYSSVGLINKTGINIVDTNTGSTFEYIWMHPLFTLAINSERGIKIDREFVLFPPIDTYTDKITKNIELNIFRALSLLRSYALGAITAKAKTGEIEVHTEKVDTFVEKVYKGSKEQLSRKKGRITADITSAFAKMEEIGIIEKGTFKEEKGYYIWGWSPSYLK